MLAAHLRVLYEIVFVDPAPNPPAIRAYNLATKKVRSILPLTELFPNSDDTGISVSPDSRWILYFQLDRSGSNIIVADHAR